MAVLGTYLYITPQPTSKRSQNPKPAQNAINPNFSRGKGIYDEKGGKAGRLDYYKGNVKERKRIEEEKGRGK